MWMAARSPEVTHEDIMHIYPLRTPSSNKTTRRGSQFSVEVVMVIAPVIKNATCQWFKWKMQKKVKGWCFETMKFKTALPEIVGKNSIKNPLLIMFHPLQSSRKASNKDPETSMIPSSTNLQSAIPRGSFTHSRAIPPQRQKFIRGAFHDSTSI